MSTSRKNIDIVDFEESLCFHGLCKPKTEFYTFEEVSRIREKLDLTFPRLQKKVQLFASFKGGTGKSSIAASYGFRLAEMGYKLLIIDLDPQGHLSSCLGYDGAEYGSAFFDVLINRKPMKESIIKTALPTLDLVPSNLTMAPIDVHLMPLGAREYRLKRALSEVRDDYDMVIMDAPPSMGLLSLNAVLSADDLIIPALADFLSYNGLRLIMETIATIGEDYSFQLNKIYVLMNRYNSHLKVCKDSKEALQKYYGDYLLNTIIRECTEFSKAVSCGQTIFQFCDTSRGAEDIKSFLAEVISQWPLEAAAFNQPCQVVPTQNQLLTQPVAEILPAPWPARENADAKIADIPVAATPGRLIIPS
ncbi:MAG: AAA family ATPase [Candidatus Riflebacteria bacterium]|nr:AAA family ATPase [Candidatus Riflebacteria bacterium]